jgi:hypothetical protein
MLAPILPRPTMPSCIDRSFFNVADSLNIRIAPAPRDLETDDGYLFFL